MKEYEEQMKKYEEQMNECEKQKDYDKLMKRCKRNSSDKSRK
jgi:hypothetical protein